MSPPEPPSLDTPPGPDGEPRCGWSLGSDLERDYHDDEWGRPVVDDRRLYEKLCLEGFQSGLSWVTILRKRENFRAAFAGFDPDVVAGFGDADIERLLGDTGIVRHRGKIEATVANARPPSTCRASTARWRLSSGRSHRAPTGSAPSGPE